ncbi:agglutinin biogenesis protein MshP [Duganella sp. FT80W]|uniref:Agglutinin biogenesis protein MshP n=1 Tax=Duganella guangzhouensis TaxID=2666084 RepID=A0A6I2L5N4_9BURK|nr:agglutinin biogenesis protein MshP [Duganella guangzhouensis]MRW93585.1 agglutinin biogenesis protein MshP [Duganella guangzhouensis]
MTTYKLQRLRARRAMRGVAIVTAIFLLVAVAGLAAVAVSLSSSQQSASAQDMQGMRAYQAAKAGMEWALYVALESSPTDKTLVNAAGRLGCQGQKASTTFAMPAGTTLSQFTVTVTCGPRIDGLGSNDANDSTAGHFAIEVTACNQPGANGCPNSSPGTDYVQRKIRAQL